MQGDLAVDAKPHLFTNIHYLYRVSIGGKVVQYMSVRRGTICPFASALHLRTLKHSCAMLEMALPSSVSLVTVGRRPHHLTLLVKLFFVVVYHHFSIVNKEQCTISSGVSLNQATLSYPIKLNKSYSCQEP